VDSREDTTPKAAAKIQMVVINVDAMIDMILLKIRVRSKTIGANITNQRDILEPDLMREVVVAKRCQ